MQKPLSLIIILVAAAGLFIAADQPLKKKKAVLIFSRTAGYRHASIAEGKTALLAMGQAHGFTADTTEDASVFNDKNLSRYDAVIFLNTTGNVLDSQQQSAFENYIRSGKGFAGIHAATDTEYDWPWFARLVGANFESHPKPQQARLLRTANPHPATSTLPATWERFDEWYNFKNINPVTIPLLKIDESSYTGGKNGENHTVSWYHNYEGSRCFYTALGHTPESYSEKLFLEHLCGGIKYAAGIK